MLITGDCFDVGKDIVGGDIDFVPDILTPYECQAECQKLQACQYWTLNTNSKRCYRKSYKPCPYMPDHSNAVSGPKFCQKGKII